MTDLPNIGAIYRLNLNPGDTLVVKLKRNYLNPNEPQMIQQEIRSLYPDHQVIVTADDVTIEATTRAQQE